MQYVLGIIQHHSLELHCAWDTRIIVLCLTGNCSRSELHIQYVRVLNRNDGKTEDGIGPHSDAKALTIPMLPFSNELFCSGTTFTRSI